MSGTEFLFVKRGRGRPPKVAPVTRSHPAVVAVQTPGRPGWRARVVGVTGAATYESSTDFATIHEALQYAQRVLRAGVPR